MAYWFNPAKNAPATKLSCSIRIKVSPDSDAGIARGTATVTISADEINFTKSLTASIPSVGIGESVTVKVGEVALPEAPVDKIDKPIEFTATLSGEVTSTTGLRYTLVSKAPAKLTLIPKKAELEVEVEVVVE